VSRYLWQRPLWVEELCEYGVEARMPCLDARPLDGFRHGSFLAETALLDSVLKRQILEGGGTP
jgi:hypothetical protein